ncbi:hypothetical protein [Thiomicrorhabdus sp.]|uniref:hypothetical protein n=1 Tax=Thiomicrorhabdus sp. TaxID=2039724 RepID=UPI002AA6FB86|nr:hypothetical protein [Thiomicrorhabdus sp.]
MAVINPSLASTALTMQNQQNGTQVKTNEKLDENSESSTKPIINNSSVTLSSAIEKSENDYLDLKATQTTNEKTAMTGTSNDSTGMTSGLTYASNLQTQNNYFSLQANDKK